MIRPALVLSTLLSVAVLPADVNAGTFFDLRIPASACRPAQGSILGARKVRLNNGTWVFTGNQSGTVTLICPVHTAQPRDLDDSTVISVMRLWYQDPDATGVQSRISARLMRRRFDAATDVTVGPLLSSQDFNETQFHRPGVTINALTDFDDFSYHVEITMFRQSANVTSPVFVGVDFAPAPTL